MRYPLSRSYGVILPSSLTRVLSRALGFSPRLPVSVYGTGTSEPRKRFFLTVWASTTSVLISLPVTSRGLMWNGFAYSTPYRLGRAFPTARMAFPPVSPHPNNGYWWHRILNRLSITYALQPRLRARLTLGGRAFPRKP